MDFVPCLLRRPGSFLNEQIGNFRGFLAKRADDRPLALFLKQSYRIGNIKNLFGRLENAVRIFLHIFEDFRPLKNVTNVTNPDFGFW